MDDGPSLPRWFSGAVSIAFAVICVGLTVTGFVVASMATYPREGNSALLVCLALAAGAATIAIASGISALRRSSGGRGRQPLP